MNTQTVGLLIGGLAPAILYGISGVLAKSSTRAGIGIGVYLACIAVSSLVVALGFYGLAPDRTLSLKSASYAVLVGLSWALATGLIAVSLIHYQAPISKLAPLYNMNTLVAVMLGLFIFSEWKEVHVPSLLIGSILIVLGGALVSRA